MTSEPTVPVAPVIKIMSSGPFLSVFWMWEVLSGFIFMGAALIALGVFGCFNARRRRGADGVRQFLIWYCFALPFMACGMCAIAFPRLHWLYYVEFGIAGLGYGVQALDCRRVKARAAAQGSVRAPSR
jgi:hypothetical protein